jgi:hypothetical protein
MAQGIFQSSRTHAPVKARKLAAGHVHKWKESRDNGYVQRVCQVKVCQAVETWNEKLGEWI